MDPETWKLEIGKYVTRIDKNVYLWKDGSPAPLRDMTLGHRAPNYRVITYGDKEQFVEIPETWQSNVRDPMAIEGIDYLIQTYGKQADIFTEDNDPLGRNATMGELPIDTPITTDKGDIIGKSTEEWTMSKSYKSRGGWIVPIDAWDNYMSKVVGIEWDMNDETAIRTKIILLATQGE